MTQKPLISFFLPFSFGAVLALSALSLSVFAAETTTLPIETHTLQDLSVPLPPTPHAKKLTKQAKPTAPQKEIISFSHKTVPPEPEKPLPSSQEADAQRLRQIKKDVSATLTDKSPAEISKPSTSPKTPVLKPHPLAHKPKIAFNPHPLRNTPISQVKKSPSSINNPNFFELGGVKLGMNFAQARTAIANHLGLKINDVAVSGSMPEPQTCTADTQLSAEGEQGAINVQFACNAGLPLHRELSVDHISYEPETGMIENVFERAVRKYGNPVNLSEYNPLKAEYVSYDWCLHPLPDRSSESGKALHCLNRNESRLRLQGRDNSLEFELIGIVGAAKDYDGDSDQNSLADDDEG